VSLALSYSGVPVRAISKLLVMDLTTPPYDESYNVCRPFYVNMYHHSGLCIIEFPFSLNSLTALLNGLLHFFVHSKAFEGDICASTFFFTPEQQERHTATCEG